MRTVVDRGMRTERAAGVYVDTHRLRALSLMIRSMHVAERELRLRAALLCSLPTGRRLQMYFVCGDDRNGRGDKDAPP